MNHPQLCLAMGTSTPSHCLHHPDSEVTKNVSSTCVLILPGI